MERVCIVTTGGTIEKTYDEKAERLTNARSSVERMLSELRLENVAVHIIELMTKDSLEINDADRTRIVEAVRISLGTTSSPNDLSGIVVLHGTHSLCVTGELLVRELASLMKPVVLTGALRPFEMRQSDALQNLTEAIFAARTLPPGVYCVAHGQALQFPGVKHDTDRGTFYEMGTSAVRPV